jgi:hypothetical protein
MRIAVLVLIVGLAWLWLCGEAAALFTGPAERDSTSGEPGAESGDAAGGAAVNPFADPESVGPGVLPESVRNRPTTWYSPPHNAKRFDRLLATQPEAVAVARAEQVPADAGPSARGHGSSHLFDYLLAAVVLAGLGAIGFLLLRERGAS